MTFLAMSLPVAQWLESPTGEREVIGSVPVRDSDFYLSHARYKLKTTFSFKKCLKIYFFKPFRYSKAKS